MRLLLARAFTMLVLFDLYLARGDFGALYNRIRNFPVGKDIPSPEAVEQILSAIDMACIWYPKRVLCLQRSAATACLLRKYGLQAQLVVGAQQLPFRAHAWVEAHGLVINDKPYVSEMYAVLTRC